MKITRNDSDRSRPREMRLSSDTSGSAPPIRIAADPSTIVRVLAAIAVLLALASLGGQYSRMYLDHPTLLGFIENFNVTGERTVPTWYTVILLFVASVGLWVTSRAVRLRGEIASSRWWAGLAFLFLVLSLDDAAEIHEMIATLMYRLGIGGEGYLMYPWVVVAVPFVLVLGLVYVRFLWTLPHRTRRLIVVAGILFFGGALGMEMIGANLEWGIRGAGTDMFPQDVRENPFSWQVVATIEELLEMLGVVVFLYAVFDYLREEFGAFRVALVTHAPPDR